MNVKNNLKSTIINKNMLIALLASCICLFIGAFEPFFVYDKSDFAYTFFTSVFCGTNSILALMFPIIACLPCLKYYSNEDNFGSKKQVSLKVSEKKYMLTKILACGISGAIAVGVPILLFLILCIASKGTLLNEYGIINWISHGKQFYMNHPILYCFGYVLNSFFCGFLMSLIGLAASVYMKNKYLVLLIPFAIYILLAMSMPNINVNLNPITLFDINSYREIAIMNNTIYKILLLIFTSGLYIYGSRRIEE